MAKTLTTAQKNYKPKKISINCKTKRYNHSPKLASVAPQNGVVQNPIPETISNDAWSMVYNSTELEDEIIRYKEFTTAHKDYFDQLSLDVRENFFNPVSRENTLKLLGDLLYANAGGVGEVIYDCECTNEMEQCN